MKKVFLFLTMTLFLMCILPGCNKKSNIEDDTYDIVNDKTVNISEPVGRVCFIDVGQADCILIQSNGHNMMIDAGNQDDYETIKSYLNQYNVNKLDYLILTHPHEDHIGSAPKLIENIPINNIMMTNLTMNTVIYQNLLTSIEEANSQIIIPKQGDSYELGEATFQILTDQTIDWGEEDPNLWSIGVKVSFYKVSFVMCGDADQLSEEEMMKSGLDLNADVLKLSHHGSRTASSDDFLKKVNPQYAIISSGKNNKYGHPHQETIETLEKNNINYFRTDTVGTIIAETNGVTINWDKEISQENNSNEQNFQDTNDTIQYIINTKTKKFHLPNCQSVNDMSDDNKKEINDSYENMINNGYSPCKNCLTN